MIMTEGEINYKIDKLLEEYNRINKNNGINNKDYKKRLMQIEWEIDLLSSLLQSTRIYFNNKYNSKYKRQ